jgi:exodeoxyribonuclease V alpha subunit
MATLVGELVKWRAHGAGGWGVGEVRRVDGSSTPVVGVLVGAREGDTIDAVGFATTHPTYGEQFKVTEARVTQPSTDAGAVAWLAATFAGVGVSRARALVEHFGGAAGLWRAIEQSPGKLALVDGITPERAQALAARYAAERGERDAHVTLRGWGLTDNQVGRCVECWLTPTGVVDAVRRNPYSLATAVDGFGFKRADVIALRSGLQRDAPARLAAAIEHVLVEASTSGGHAFLWSRPFQHELVSERVLGHVERRALLGAIGRALVEGRIIRRGGRVYLARLHAAEARVASLLGERL